MSDIEEITLAELLQLAVSNRLVDLHVSMPAKVESYDHSAQTVDVVPQLNRSLPDGAGNFVTERLPKLSAIPVVFQRCQQFAMTFPLQAGDYGLVVFCERNIAAWRATGSQGDPGDLGMHTLDGAVFVPGLYPDSLASSKADATNMVLGSETNDSARIVIKPSGEVDVGAAATNFVAMADKVLTELQSIATKFNSHTHTGGTFSNLGGAVTGVSGSPNVSYSASAVASSNLKAND